MIKYLKLILIVLLVILNCSLVYKYRIKKVNPDNTKGLEIKVDLLNTILIARNLCDGTEVDSAFHLLQDNGDTLSISQLTRGKAKLVVWFSQISCQSCVDSLLNKVFAIANKNDLLEEIILIADYQNQQYLYDYKRINQVSLPFYNPLNKLMINSVDFLVPPYLFVIDENLCIQHLFIPEKSFLPKELSYYIQDFINRYITKNTADNFTFHGLH